MTLSWEYTRNRGKMQHVLYVLTKRRLENA
jgi:hypothetical protein